MAADDIPEAVHEVTDRLEAVAERLEAQRAQLSKNQLKKLRKKRSRLAHQVVSAQLGNTEEPDSDQEPLTQPSMHPPAKRPKPHPHTHPDPAAAAARPPAQFNLLRGFSPAPGDSEHSHHSTNSQHLPNQGFEALQHAQSPAWHQQQQHLQRLQHGSLLARPGKALPRQDQQQQQAQLQQPPAAAAAAGALLMQPGATAAAVGAAADVVVQQRPPIGLPTAAAGRRSGGDFSQLLRVMRVAAGPTAPTPAAAAAVGGAPSASLEDASAASLGGAVAGPTAVTAAGTGAGAGGSRAAAAAGGAVRGGGAAAGVPAGPLSQLVMVSESLDVAASEQDHHQQQHHHHHRRDRMQKAREGVKRDLAAEQEAQHQQGHKQQQQQEERQSHHHHQGQQQQAERGLGQDQRCRTDLSGQLVLLSAELSGSLTEGPAQQQKQQQPQEGFKGESATQPVSRRKQRNSYIYGNYRHYYGYRLEHGHQDPRVKVLRPEWFKGKELLDIGCNEGLVTLAFAAQLGCRRVTGVDIDGVLVNKACTNLRRMRTDVTEKYRLAKMQGHGRYASSSKEQSQQPEQQQDQQQQQQLDGQQEPNKEKKQKKEKKRIRHQGEGPHQEEQEQQEGQGQQQQQREVGQHDCPGDCDQEQQQGQKQQQQQERKKQRHAHQQGQQTYDQQGQGRREQQQGQGQQQLQLQQRIHRLQQLESGQVSLSELGRQVKALSRVTFKHSNWLELPCGRDKYDVITCLSVTKWVHLHHGDDGLMRLFNKMYRCLAPGGLLILEPQPWKSYNSAVHKQDMHEVPFRRYEQLKLRPEGFVDFLTSRVGFVLLEEMQPEVLAAAREAEGGSAGTVVQTTAQQKGLQKGPGACAAVAGGDKVKAGEGGRQQGHQQEKGEEAGKGKVRGFDRPMYVLQKPFVKAS